ncbi:MAG: ABC transporter permease [Chloroflexi bacterium]|nr:ABC transporter permease [Chloroflexota bacterium]
MSLGMIALYAQVGAYVVFLAAPIVMVVLLSFTAGEFAIFPPEGLSLRWYGPALAMPGFIDSLVLSLQLAAQAATLSLLLGVSAALGLARTRFRGRQALLAGIMSPLVVPTIVSSLALLQFFVGANLREASWNLLVGHVIITLPYVVRTVLASFEVFDWSLVDTARVLGAGPVRAFWRVTLPVIRPGVLAGGIFSFLVSFDSFTISVFLVDSQSVTLPVRVFNYILTQLDPRIAALSALLIYGSIAVLVVSDRLIGTSRLRGF